ncbi:SDR family NAD(P)-dependent oxidoreductase [Pseudorhodoferax sp. Leaf267]|uniref:SDR family NAD(P)-dependent oxidoreductase n=1 Tax=Pseudorhodoferax sp. Leaf267 TaxID=1736316 RepID=UPI0006F312AC|nr:SDR family NAD(P)-dependent oxidoreductase [Pseudorhodoferax sp. Leaf267]KQP21572.1 short-chain dehydrogenase [Pseudorhodoferax sp. Leaf267]
MRLAILTGGSRGLGLALCEALAERGYRVMEFSRGAPHAYSVRLDLSSPGDSHRIAATAVASFGNKHIEELLVVSNAGTLDSIGPASRQERAAVLANVNTNFTSAILVLTEIVAHFQDTPCRKVLANISSGAAQRGYAGWSLYCAAKAGMENYVRALALEQQLEPHPFIPINVDPGVIDTEMQALIRSSSAADFPEIERFIKRKEQGALVSPEKVAGAVCHILQLTSLSFGARYEVGDYGA